MSALVAIGRWCLQYWYVVALAALIGGLALYGQKMRSERDAVRAEYADFRREVATAAQKAAELALQRTIADERKREQADAENARLHADADRLRAERDAARRSLLSPAPAGSRCPDGQACFDRAELERAYGALVGEVRGLADEGTAVTIDLDTAKRWAAGR